MQLLTTAEAAAYLRLKERKLYELVAENAIPCTKVTGRWLFPKHELDRWLAQSLHRPEGFAPGDPMPIIGGSHDPLLEWGLRESGSGLASLPEGSEAGLERFLKGELIAAAIHLHALADLDADANVDAMRGRPHLHDAVLIAFLRREQGLVVARGNPLNIRSLADAAARRARLAVRPPGAGAQLLLLALLHRANLKIDRFKAGSPPCPTGPDVAQAIRAGRADCGLASRAVAEAAGLDFVPLHWERFDLILRQRDYFRAPLQAFLGFLRSPAFAARARARRLRRVGRGRGPLRALAPTFGTQVRARRARKASIREQPGCPSSCREPQPGQPRCSLRVPNDLQGRYPCESSVPFPISPARCATVRSRC